MSWFEEREGFIGHMKYREMNPHSFEVKYDGLTQYGFHKFLNAKYSKLLPEYKILGIRNELKPKLLNILENIFELKVSKDYIILPEVEIKKENTEILLKFLEQLFVIGFAKEYIRGRLPELKLD